MTMRVMDRRRNQYYPGGVPVKEKVVVDHSLRVDVDGAVRSRAIKPVGELPVRERAVAGVDVGSCRVLAAYIFAQPPWQNARATAPSDHPCNILRLRVVNQYKNAIQGGVGKTRAE